MTKSKDEETKEALVKVDNDADAATDTNTVDDTEKEPNEYDQALNERFWPLGKRKLTAKEIGIMLTGAAAVGLNVASMVYPVKSNYPTYLVALTSAGAVSTAVVAPVAAVGETKLTLMGTLRESINEVRGLVNRFSAENQKLKLANDELETSVARLKEVATGLENLAKEQGCQTDKLFALIEENRKINQEMMEVLKANALERILSLLIEVDSDGDFNLEGAEVERLIFGLSGIEEIEVDKDELRERFKEMGSFSIDVFFKFLKDCFDGGSEENNDTIAEEDEE